MGESDPKRMGLDAIRQAIEERDEMERRYHDLAAHLVYRGNSVSWWHSKATAYREAIDAVWAALREAGVSSDGTKTCADAVRELAAMRADAERWRYFVTHCEWLRRDDGFEPRYSSMSIRLPYEADQSCVAMRNAAIDAARESGK